jgi:nucleoside-diphosphate-sugar epimerase
MNILITGVNGFVGKKLYKELIKNHEVIGIYNSGNSSFENCFKVDLLNEIETNNLFERISDKSINTIIHLASQTANSTNINNFSIININSTISINISKAAAKFGVEQFINLSSSSIYPNVDGIYNEESIPNPALNSDCLYGLSKYNCEVLINYFLKSSNIKITHLRCGMIYGDGMDNTRLIPILENEILEQNSVTLYGNGLRLLNLISVENLVRYISFFINQNSNEIINVADECVSVLDLANRIIAEKGDSSTKIILKEDGNRSQFVLDVKRLKYLIKDNKNV